MGWIGLNYMRNLFKLYSSERRFSHVSPENIVFRNLIWIIDFSSEVFSLCKSLDKNTLEMQWEEDFYLNRRLGLEQAKYGT